MSTGLTRDFIDSELAEKPYVHCLSSDQVQLPTIQQWLNNQETVIVLYETFSGMESLMSQLPRHPLLQLWPVQMDNNEWIYRLLQLLNLRDQLEEFDTSREIFKQEMTLRSQLHALEYLVNDWRDQKSVNTLVEMSLRGLIHFLKLQACAFYTWQTGEQNYLLANTQGDSSLLKPKLAVTWSKTDNIQIISINEQQEQCQLILRIEGLDFGLLVFIRDKSSSEHNFERTVLKQITHAWIEIYQNILHIAQVEELACRDNLTQLFNRNGIENHMKKHFSSTSPNPLGLLMLDVDLFKKVNDTYGHHFGDMVLKNIAQHLQSHCAPGSLTFRFGGEEMGMLVPTPNRSVLWKIAQSVRKDIAAIAWDAVLADSNVHLEPGILPTLIGKRITVSIGTSLYPDDFADAYHINFAATWERLLQKADGALYKAKHQGRNRVHMYEQFSFHAETVRKIVRPILEELRRHHPDTFAHSVRVAVNQHRLLQKLGFSQLHQRMGFWTGLLHDIGKLQVPMEILGSTQKLGADEYVCIKKHPQSGFDHAHNHRVLAFALDGIRFHHEAFDGKGYSTGLHSEDIPLMVRLLSLSDAFDAMYYGRSYNEPKNINNIISELSRYSGSQFDPDLTTEFIEFIKARHMGIRC